VSWLLKSGPIIGDFISILIRRAFVFLQVELEQLVQVRLGAGAGAACAFAGFAALSILGCIICIPLAIICCVTSDPLPLLLLVFFLFVDFKSSFILLFNFTYS